MRIGILGGTFDPIHFGHLALADAAYHKLNLNRVIFVPAYQSPIGLPQKQMTSASIRLAMVRAAVNGIPHYKISDVEIRRRGISYTVDTVRYFRGRLAERDELFFISGGDWGKTLDQWKEFSVITSLCHFVVAKRSGFENQTLPEKVQQLDFTPLDISATKVRQMIRDGLKTDRCIPESVTAIIQKHHLYRNS